MKIITTNKKCKKIGKVLVEVKQHTKTNIVQTIVTTLKTLHTYPRELF